MHYDLRHAEMTSASIRSEDLKKLCLAVLCVVVGVGCGPQPVATRTRATWRMLDSTWVSPWDEMTDSLKVYRLVASLHATSDTLTDVIEPWPIVADDSTLWGVRVIRATAERSLFRFTWPARTLESVKLPGDMPSNFSDISVSPTGEYLAYVAYDSSGGPFAVVKKLPAGKLLLKSPSVGGCDCDVDLNHARWVTPDSFEIALVSTADSRGWAIAAGSVGQRRLQTHFVTVEPAWHHDRGP
jgi:hypothetical protein